MKKTLFSFLAVAALCAAQQVPPPAIQPAGNAQPVIENYYQALSQTATISTFNLQCIAPSQPAIATSPNLGIQPVSPLTQSAICPAGVYRASVFIENTAGTNGGGTVTNTLGFHTSATAQTANVTSTLTESTGNFQQGSYVFRSDGTANITFATAQSSTGTYNVRVVLERLN